jgi:hypothetical protein
MKLCSRNSAVVTLSSWLHCFEARVLNRPMLEGTVHLLFEVMAYVVEGEECKMMREKQL